MTDNTYKILTVVIGILGIFIGFIGGKYYYIEEIKNLHVELTACENSNIGMQIEVSSNGNGDRVGLDLDVDCAEGEDCTGLSIDMNPNK